MKHSFIDFLSVFDFVLIRTCTYACIGNYTGTGDAMAALLLSWTHLLLRQQQLQQSGQQLGCHTSDRTSDTGDSSTDGASSSDGSSIGPSSCVGGGGVGSGDVGGDEKEVVGSNPFSGALCNALSTVKVCVLCPC